MAVTFFLSGVNLQPYLRQMMRMVTLYLTAAVSCLFLTTWLFFTENRVAGASIAIADIAFLILWESLCFVATEFLFNDVTHFFSYRAR